MVNSHGGVEDGGTDRSKAVAGEAGRPVTPPSPKTTAAAAGDELEDGRARAGKAVRGERTGIRTPPL